ncbi:outer membrane protein with beta-barrel domain [Mucilaginibacter yixingensis]|uniref:Outer membrane protein with beta-barrel domain n=1 Tax=Mucilaginibacter yixingensis TaxID=1295612 RepID=A0A2T5J7D4_9SPHI|nr:outer membrane beta-barrel protein [Mucilaginibacter yixingensis]PTQ95055.1 outer membrane protein with beta-barrel domain [Mucilaginibacter yixingensis]
MKKILSICILVLVAHVASAQLVNLGFRGRFTSAKLTGGFNGASSNTSWLNMVDIGIFPELDYGTIVFQPGLAFIQKGGSSKPDRSASLGSNSLEANLTINYLELPLNVLYKIPLKPNKILLGGGPYLAYATTAHTTVTTFDQNGNMVNDKQKTAIPLGGGPNDLKHFDYGINLLATFRIKNGIEAGLGAGFGLGNLSNTSTVKTHNQTLSVSLGYFFQ